MDRLSERNVFFCYSPEDEELISDLLDVFLLLDLNVLNYELDEKNELTNINKVSSTLYKHLSRGDYLIMALTENSVNSEWMKNLLNDLELRYRFRDIIIISLRMNDCSIPDHLMNEIFVDFTDLAHPNPVGDLIQVLKCSSLIDLKEFNHENFENLILNLLKSLGFKNLEREFPIKFARDYNNINSIISEKPYEALKLDSFNEEYLMKFDFKGEYPQMDPFGLIDETLWIIDVKLKRNEIDPRFIKQVGKYVSKLPEKYQLAIITSGHLTSSSKDSIDKLQENARVKIKIIDGPGLRKILVQNPLVVKKHFLREIN